MQFSRRTISGVLGSALILQLTSVDANAAPQSSADRAFAALARRWFDGAMRLEPVSATQIGDHRFDLLLDDMSRAGRNAKISFARTLLGDIARIDKAKLSRANQVDAAILSNSLNQQIWNIETAQEWAWNPLNYQSVAGSAIYGLLAREFAPITTRLEAVMARMLLFPRLLQQARNELVIARVPAPHAATYSSQNAGLKSIVKDMVEPNAHHLSAAKRRQLAVAIEIYEKAIQGHQIWIDRILVPAAKGDFRVGAAIFDAGLGYTLQSELSRQQIKERAKAQVINVRTQMYALSRQILLSRGKASLQLPLAPNDQEQQVAIRAALDLAADDHPARDKLVETATNMVEFARKFVMEKDLITLPEGPVLVILMPEFKRGFAGAYCDSPGPLEKQLPTFYAVSPIPDDWTDEQATSYLREDNNRSIQDIGVHEAMPGHYVQLYHGNSYPSVLRAILSSGSFVEGWAVYAEQMMVEQGFKADDPLYKLSQLKVQLRTIVNALIDQAIHCDGMTREECIHELTQTAFQEEREAAGKWRRAQLSYNQLSTYFVGFMEHLDAREGSMAQKGANFNLKAYHDGILSFGAPPMRFAKALLLNSPI